MAVRIADALELEQAGRQGVSKTVFSGQSELGPEDPAFCLAFPGYSSPWEMAHENKEFAEVGHTFMREQGSTSRMKIDHLLKARDWSEFGEARIVDVGGSLGHASIALASALPNATFIVQDANTVALDQGRELVSQQFPHLIDRISFAQHDFFTPMPAMLDGDIFLFQWILHDWNDADALRIIKSLVPGLKPGARVFIAEAVRPAPPAAMANTLDEKLVLFQDMTMLAAHKARERSVAEFVRIFEEADARFHHVSTGGGKDGAYRSLLEFEFRA
jgi:6-hydroxytryprostatin B O-methyltransferase